MNKLLLRLGRPFCLGLTCLLLTLPTAPVYGSTPPNPPEALPGGNTPNHGQAVSLHGSVYYLDTPGDVYAGGSERIFRIDRQQGGTPVPVSSDEAWDLTAAAGWLYYSNWSDHHRIYRMKADGTEKTVLSTDAASCLAPIDDHLLYIRWSSAGAANNHLYRIPLEGGDAERLCDDRVELFSAAGEWVYYVNVSDNNSLYRIHPDGSSRGKVTADAAVFLATAGDWIYYSNYDDGLSLYKIRGDGSGKTLLSRDACGFINTNGDWVYYTHAGDGNSLYRIKTDGSSRQKVLDLSAAALPIAIVEGEVYYDGQFLTI